MESDFAQNLSVKEVSEILTKEQIHQFALINIDGNILCSHSKAEFFVPLIERSNEWHNHEAVFVRVDIETSCLYIVSIHSTKRGRPEGGARLKCYENICAAIDDCLRLAYGMTLKNATGDIWEGGAKSVIVPFSSNVFTNLMEEKAEARDEIGPTRQKLWKNFGEFISSLKGLYLVGEDVNLNSADMACILQYCVHTSCLDKLHGGSGNPSPFTAAGVLQAIKGSIESVFPKNSSLIGKRILIKGLGNVGYALATELIKENAKVIVYDPINTKAKERIKAEFPHNNVEIVEDYDTFISMKAHVFSPNSNSLSINKKDIEQFNVKIICGAENGQLEDVKLAEYLHKKGIVYIPETWINYMGVYSAYQEHRGILGAEFEQKLKCIYAETKDMLLVTKKYNLMPYKYAIVVAHVKAEQLHPIDGHRGIKIEKELFEEWGTI